MCTRWYGGLFISASRRTGRAKALSLSDVTNAAFNAQPLRLVIIIAVGNARAQALSLSLSFRLPFLFPFRVPSEQKTSFPSSLSELWPPGPNLVRSALLSLSLSLSLFFSVSLDTLVYSFSEPWTGSAGFGYCFSGRESLEKKKEERVPDWVWIRGSLCWFSTKSIAPKDGTHCFISNESVTLSVRPTRDCLELFISVSTLCFLNLSSI